MGFLNDRKGQADIADVLILALLVSFSSYLVWTYGLGTYKDNLHLRALRYRYTEDLCQSFVLTSRYLSDTSDPLNYIIGPRNSTATLPKIIKKATGISPLERRLRGNVIDLIAEDLFLSLSFKNNSRVFNNLLLSGNFHSEVEKKISENMNYLSSGLLDYRIEGSYHPYKGTAIDQYLFSETTYVSAPLPKDASIYMSNILVSIPVDGRALENIALISAFNEKFCDISRLIFPSPVNLSERINKLDGTMSDVASLLDMINSTMPYNNLAEIKIMVWEKVEN